MEKSIVSKMFSPKKFSDDKLKFMGTTVLEMMTGNPHFPDIQPKLDNLKTDTDNYSASLNNLINGGRMETLVKNNCRKQLESTLGELAEYVQLTSQGDAGIILSSGFHMHKKHEAVGVLPQPDSFRVRMGNAHGSVVLSCDVIANTKVYLFEYTLAPVNKDSVWIQIASTRHKIQIGGLQSGQQYAFRAAAAGTCLQLIWSDEIYSYVI